MRLMLIGLAAVTLATPQNSRSFHLTQNETADQMNQIATLIRSTGGIQQIWADEAWPRSLQYAFPKMVHRSWLVTNPNTHKTKPKVINTRKVILLPNPLA